MQADVEFQGFQMTLSLVKTAARAAPVVTAAEHPVPPVFLDRWSPRAFTGEPIPDTSLQCVFEAARWARPVCGLEPWRFVYAKRDTAAWPKFLGFLSPTDRSWAENASALIVVLSKSPPSRRRRPGDPAYNPSFEAGAAWASLAFQAFLTGWSTCAIGRYDSEAARRELNAPDDHSIEAVVAIGRRSRESEFERFEAPRLASREPAPAFESAFPDCL